MTGASGCGPSGGNPSTFLITFSLSGTPEPLSLLSFRVLYDAKDDFSGTGTSVACELLDDAGDATATIADDDNGVLVITLEAEEDEPFDEVSELVECRYQSDSQPTTQSFTVTVLSAKDEDGITVAPNAIDVLVSGIELLGEAASLRVTDRGE
jgi:hypothetical protein